MAQFKLRSRIEFMNSFTPDLFKSFLNDAANKKIHKAIMAAGATHLFPKELRHKHKARRTLPTLYSVPPC